ncbi:MAG: hypothetical protein MJ236_02550 [Clostridia bacterium]|nr:hypothetical protein [Clostridia bacterium]
MAHAVVRTDKMWGTDVRSGLVSLKYVTVAGSAVTPAGVIDNGNVLKIDGLMDGEREIYKGVAVTADDTIEDVVLVDSVELMYDERKRNLDEFENAKGAIIRGYVLHTGDIFSVTAEALKNASPAVGQKIELAAGTKLANVTTSTKAIGKIIAKEVAGRYTYYVIEID